MLLLPIFFPFLLLSSSTSVTYVQVYEPLELGYSVYFEGTILELDIKENICKFYDLTGKLVFDFSITEKGDKPSLEKFKMRFEPYQENKLMLFVDTDNSQNKPIVYQLLSPLEKSEIELLLHKKRSDVIEINGHYFWESTPRGFLRPIVKVEENYFEYKLKNPQQVYF